MKLIARKTLRYGTRSLRAGDEFEASARDGKLLQAIGSAMLPPAPPPAPKPRAYRAKVVAVEEVKPQAVEVDASVPAVLPDPLPAEEAAAPKPRTYTRRDLVADE